MPLHHMAKNEISIEVSFSSSDSAVHNKHTRSTLLHKIRLAILRFVCRANIFTSNSNFTVSFTRMEQLNSTKSLFEIDIYIYCRIGVDDHRQMNLPEFRKGAFSLFLDSMRFDVVISLCLVTSRWNTNI